MNVRGSFWEECSHHEPMEAQTVSIRTTLSRRRPTPAGIECSLHGYRIVQVDQYQGSRVRSACMVPGDLTVDDVDMPALRKAVRNLSGRRCIVSPLNQSVIVRPARMPRLKGDEFREAARWEAAEMFECDAQELVAEPLVVSGAPGEDGRHDVLIVAARLEDVQRALEPLLTAGLRPVAVEPSFLGAGRAFALRTRRKNDDPVSRAVVHIGHQSSSLVVMSGDRSIFAKTISVGGEAFNQIVSDRLGIDELTASEIRRDAAAGRLSMDILQSVRDAIRRPADELSNEVAMSLRYVSVAARIGSVQVIHVCGDEAGNPGIIDSIKSSCQGIPVSGESVADQRLIDAMQCGGGAPADWAVAFGLAIRPHETRVQGVAA